MTDESSSVGRTVVRRLQTRADRTRRGFDDDHILLRLTTADYLSLVALFFAWTAAVLFFTGEPNWAIVTTFVAFLFDKLDGYYARSHGTPSPLGRQIDSFIDIFTYLVPAALLYHYALSPSTVVSAVVGFAILAFGGLRLIRFNDEGFHTDGDASYYRGSTVVHTHLLVLANYFLAVFVPAWNGWLAAALVLPACPLMVSNYRSYKTDATHALVAVAGLVAIGLSLAVEFGW